MIAVINADLCVGVCLFEALCTVFLSLNICAFRLRFLLSAGLLIVTAQWICKLLLTAELILAYGPVGLLWMLGLLASPVLLLNLFTNFGIPSLAAVVAFLLGGFGLWGASKLVLKVLNPLADVAVDRNLYRQLGLGGIAAALGMVYFSAASPVFGVAIAASIMATLHFLLLHRCRERSSM